MQKKKHPVPVSSNFADRFRKRILVKTIVLIWDHFIRRKLFVDVTQPISLKCCKSANNINSSSSKQNIFVSLILFEDSRYRLIYRLVFLRNIVFMSYVNLLDNGVAFKSTNILLLFFLIKILWFGSWCVCFCVFRMRPYYMSSIWFCCSC